MTTIHLARPTDLASVRAAVLDSTGPMLIAGAGTAADWAGRPGPVETVLDTTGLTGVITHNPGDMTVSVRAGTPLLELARELAPHAQHVAFDAARVTEGATVGGLFATADSGPSALTHGSLRDLVIGVTMVLADGTVARSGGHVIKNVAGYDLAKLLHGSYGTLAVVAEVVLRLHPIARGSVTLVLDCPLPEAAQVAERVLRGPSEPTGCEWISGPSVDGTLLVRLEGTPEALPARADRLRTDVDLAPVTGSDPWLRHAELTAGAEGQAVLRIGVRPSKLAEVLAALPATAVTAGLGTGIATVTLPVAAVAQAHALVHAAGGTSMLRSRPPGADVPALGPAPSAIGVLKAIKSELDPNGRFGPGRFEPWMAS